jgi:hypothetical protein
VKVLNVVLNLAVFAAAIIGPPVALWYLLRWLGSGFNHRPTIAWAIGIFLVALLVFAAATFHHFFPNCHAGYRMICF